MIQEIRYQNVQPHRQRRLAFEPGLNVIVGETDKGKSSLIRGLRWLALHESASGLITHGETVMKVGVKTPNGTIIRFKDSKESGYKLGEEYFKACKTDQPKEVQDRLSLTEINFQSQFDSMFLLAATGGQRAKEINKLVALEDIDLATTWLKSKSAKLATLMQAAEDKISKCNADLGAYVDLDERLKIYASLREVFDRISENNTRARALTQFICELETIDGFLRTNLAATMRLEKLIAALERLEATKAAKAALESLVSDQKAVESLPRLDAAIKALDGLIAVRERQSKLQVLFGEHSVNETHIFVLNGKIPVLVEGGLAIVEATKKKRETLKNILGSIRAVRDEFDLAATAAKETEARLAELEKPTRCQACGKCVMYCETC
jgi:exonuclease SbcC